jgi:hypothetical protein
LSKGTDDFDDFSFVEANAASVPSWRPKQAGELIETLERLYTEHIMFPDKPFTPVNELAVVEKTRKRLAEYDEILLPEFDLRLEAVRVAYSGFRHCLLEEPPESVQDAQAELFDHCRGFIAWLDDPRSPSDLKSGAAPQSKSRCPVKLQGKGQPVFVNGHELDPLPDNQYVVVELLVGKYPNGATTSAFESKGIYSVNKVLDSISCRPGWESVIEFPGGKGKDGYRLRGSI